jgi:hypothetical protein
MDRSSYAVDKISSGFISRSDLAHGIFYCAIFLSAIDFLNIALIPIARWSATAAANERWSGLGEEVTIILPQDDKPGKTAQSSDSSQSNAISAEWNANFTSCQSRGALLSVFSDDSTHFLLCRSLDDPQSGVVFEVTKEKGLISARNVSEGG